MSADLWQQSCERLATELPEQQFNTWIRPLPDAEITQSGAEPTVVSVRVPNRFKLDWIRNQYAGRIEAVLSEIAGRPVRFELTLAPREAPPAAAMVNAPVLSTQWLLPQAAPAGSAPAAQTSNLPRHPSTSNRRRQ